VTGTWVAAVVAAVAGAAAGFIGRPLLRRLPAPRSSAAEVDKTVADLTVDEALVRKPPPTSATRPTDLIGEPTEPDPSAAPDQAIDGQPGSSPYVPLADDPRTTTILVGVGALGCGVVGAAVGWNAALPAWIVLGVVGTLLGYIDARTRYLPTAVIAPAYGATVILLVGMALVAGETDRLLPALYGWLLFGGFYLLMWLVYRRGIGYGDVRLAGLLGPSLGFVGWGATLTALYAGLLVGAVVGTVLVLTRLVRGRSYPFGPFMLVGAVVGLVWGRHLGGWYASL
jgi:leader peptidase (prepilin peptidase) / N-methyltransferase